MLRIPRPRLRPNAVLRAALLAFACVALLQATGVVRAEGVAVPGFAVDPLQAQPAAARFMADLRAALRAGGARVSDAPLITPGIAGSLDPDFGKLVARLEGTRYAVLGEFRARGDGIAVDLLPVDAHTGRVGDLQSRAFAPSEVAAVVAELSAALLAFMTPPALLPVGSAGLFVSSTPSGAEVVVAGVVVGRTGDLDLLTLAPGRYEVEIRTLGYLSDVRTLDLRSDDTRFLHVTLTELQGGSVQIVARPLPARILLDGRDVGITPVTIAAAPGEREVTLSRPGFASRTLQIPVRQFRVTRVEADLEPLAEPLLVWEAGAYVRVIVDGVLQEDGWSLPGPGLHTFEILRAGSVRRVTIVVPDRGVFELLPDRGEIRPLLLR
jgi:hypothetical protein